jgi:hypothetical protein
MEENIMFKVKNTKQILSALLVCILAFSLILVPHGVAQGFDFDESLYGTEEHEVIENDESELTAIEICSSVEAEYANVGAELFTVGQGDATIFGPMPTRIATPLRNQILSIWVGTISNIHHQNSIHWELVWPIPYFPLNNPPSTANPPSTIPPIHLEGATHIAFRLSNRIHQTATFRFNEIVQTRINQPGLLMTESYTINGGVTPTGGVGMAFVNNAVFPLPANIDTNPTFTLRLSFQQNNPPFLENQSYNITVLTGPREAGTATELQNAINAAPANTATTIEITNSFSMGNAIHIPANRDITLISSNTNARILSQMNEEQRHFTVLGRLTLGQNITLSGGLAYSHIPAQTFQDVQEPDESILSRSMSEVSERNAETGTERLREELSRIESANRTTSSNSAVVSGGVAVGPGGIFTMNAGSIIEDCMFPFGGAVEVWGTGTAASTRGIFNLNGGLLQFNIALNGGAVDLFGNARMNMTSGTITGNQVFEDGGGVWVGTGFVANGQGFNMTGGSIVGNFATIDGGAIYSDDFLNGYRDISTGASTVFSQNWARGWVTPPPVANRPAHIRSASASIAGYILNNFDIIYWGQLG